MYYRAALLVLFAAPGIAQVDVAVLAAGSSACARNDVVDKLEATGFFAIVDVMDVSQMTPSLQQLAAYDAVLTYSYHHYHDSVAFGNVLADYVDAGGGVVAAQFAMATNFDIAGRWDQGYEVILPAGWTWSSQAALGTVHEPSHAVMNAVQSFDGGWAGSAGSPRATSTTLAPGAIRIADWTDGIALVAQGANPLRVDLGFFPPSNACDGRYWDQTTDGDLLMANALLFVAGVFFDRYCTPAQPNSTGGPARISAHGSPLTTTNDLTLTAEDLPPGEFGYFLVGSNQGQFQPPGSQGLICLTCSGFQGCAGIGRYNQIGNIIQGPTGSISVDLTALPLTPAQAVMPGDTWNFQCWFRDLGSSNFTDAISITFL